MLWSPEVYEQTLSHDSLNDDHFVGKKPLFRQSQRQPSTSECPQDTRYRWMALLACSFQCHFPAVVNEWGSSFTHAGGLSMPCNSATIHIFMHPTFRSPAFLVPGSYSMFSPDPHSGHFCLNASDALMTQNRCRIRMYVSCTRFCSGVKTGGGEGNCCFLKQTAQSPPLRRDVSGMIAELQFLHGIFSVIFKMPTSRIWLRQFRLGTGDSQNSLVRCSIFAVSS